MFYRPNQERKNYFKELTGNAQTKEEAATALNTACFSILSAAPDCQGSDKSLQLMQLCYKLWNDLGNRSEEIGRTLVKSHFKAMKDGSKKAR